MKNSQQLLCLQFIYCARATTKIQFLFSKGPDLSRFFVPASARGTPPCMRMAQLWQRLRSALRGHCPLRCFSGSDLHRQHSFWGNVYYTVIATISVHLIWLVFATWGARPKLLGGPNLRPAVHILQTITALGLRTNRNHCATCVNFSDLLVPAEIWSSGNLSQNPQQAVVAT